MQRITAFVVLLATVLLAGCSTVSVNQDYDTQLNFADFRTYDWVQQNTGAPADAQSAQATSDIMAQRIQRAVDANLQGKGLRQTSNNPDMMVAYHIGLQDKVNVTNWGYNSWDPRWGWGGNNVDVTQYTEGTLIIDLIDASTMQLAWRGTATKAVDSSSQTPQGAENMINSVVGKILAQYPPR